MTTNSGIAGLVLAGGRGLRMGGQDKGLLPLAGRPLVAHVLDALRPQVAALAISANRNLDRYRGFGVPVLPDPVPGFPGPLAGMLAGFEQFAQGAVAALTPPLAPPTGGGVAAPTWLLIVPCDMPALPPDLGARLHAAAASAGVLAAYAQAGDESLYACCLLHRSLAAALRCRLEGEDRSVRSFLSAVGAAAVRFETWPAAGRNLNTPAEFAQAAKLSP